MADYPDGTTLAEPDGYGADITAHVSGGLLHCDRCIGAVVGEATDARWYQHTDTAHRYAPHWRHGRLAQGGYVPNGGAR